MNLTIIHLVLLLKVISARNVFMPRFFQQDSSIVVDTDKIPMRQLQYYPIYHTVGKVNPTKNEKLITKELPKSIEVKQQTTTYSPQEKDDFPKDLLDIARTKLGIKHLEEIPSIYELGDLLGTEGVKETINYLREITATDEGIAFVKAYIESLDYTDSTSITTIPSIIDYTPTKDKIDPDINLETPSFFERLSAYFSVFDFFLSSKNTGFEKTLQPDASNITPKTIQKPQLVRHSLPYYYPIPLRPMAIYSPHNGYHPAGHLNTPKFLKRPVETAHKQAMKRSKSENLPQQKNKKLTRLAEKISKFPLTYDRSALIDAQYLSTIGKSIEQDEELKKIMASAETLK